MASPDDELLEMLAAEAEQQKMGASVSQPPPENVLLDMLSDVAKAPTPNAPPEAQEQIHHKFAPKEEPAFPEMGAQSGDPALDPEFQKQQSDFTESVLPGFKKFGEVLEQGQRFVARNNPLTLMVSAPDLLIPGSPITDAIEEATMGVVHTVEKTTSAAAQGIQHGLANPLGGALDPNKPMSQNASEFWDAVRSPWVEELGQPGTEQVNQRFQQAGMKRDDAEMLADLINISAEVLVPDGSDLPSAALAIRALAKEKKAGTLNPSAVVRIENKLPEAPDHYFDPNQIDTELPAHSYADKKAEVRDMLEREAEAGRPVAAREFDPVDNAGRNPPEGYLPDAGEASKVPWSTYYSEAHKEANGPKIKELTDRLDALKMEFYSGTPTPKQLQKAAEQMVELENELASLDYKRSVTVYDRVDKEYRFTDQEQDAINIHSVPTPEEATLKSQTLQKMYNEGKISRIEWLELALFHRTEPNRKAWLERHSVFNTGPSSAGPGNPTHTPDIKVHNAHHRKVTALLNPDPANPPDLKYFDTLVDSGFYDEFPAVKTAIKQRAWNLLAKEFNRIGNERSNALTGKFLDNLGIAQVHDAKGKALAYATTGDIFSTGDPTLMDSPAAKRSIARSVFHEIMHVIATRAPMDRVRGLNNIRAALKKYELPTGQLYKLNRWETKFQDAVEDAFEQHAGLTIKDGRLTDPWGNDYGKHYFTELGATGQRAEVMRAFLEYAVLMPNHPVVVEMRKKGLYRDLIDRYVKEVWEADPSELLVNSGLDPVIVRDMRDTALERVKIAEEVKPFGDSLQISEAFDARYADIEARNGSVENAGLPPTPESAGVSTPQAPTGIAKHAKHIPPMLPVGESGWRGPAVQLIDEVERKVAYVRDQAMLAFKNDKHMVNPEVGNPGNYSMNPRTPFWKAASWRKAAAQLVEDFRDLGSLRKIINEEKSLRMDANLGITQKVFAYPSLIMSKVQRFSANVVRSLENMFIPYFFEGTLFHTVKSEKIEMARHLMEAAGDAKLVGTKLFDEIYDTFTPTKWKRPLFALLRNKAVGEFFRREGYFPAFAKGFEKQTSVMVKALRAFNKQILKPVKAGAFNEAIQFFTDHGFDYVGPNNLSKAGKEAVNTLRKQINYFDQLYAMNGEFRDVQQAWALSQNMIQKFQKGKFLHMPQANIEKLIKRITEDGVLENLVTEDEGIRSTVTVATGHAKHQKAKDGFLRDPRAALRNTFTDLIEERFRREAMEVILTDPRLSISAEDIKKGKPIPAGFVPVEELNVPLSGRYVHPDVTRIFKRGNPIENKALRMVKFLTTLPRLGATIYNPVGHFYNRIMAELQILNYSNNFVFSPGARKKLKADIADFKAQRQDIIDGKVPVGPTVPGSLRHAMEVGLMQYHHNDPLFSGYRSSMQKVLQTEAGVEVPKTFFEKVVPQKAQDIHDKLIRAYMSHDELAKWAIFRGEIAKGTDAIKAKEIALTSVVNTSRAGSVIQWMGRSGLGLFTPWRMQSIPALLGQFVANPMVYVNGVIVGLAARIAMQTLWGATSGDEEMMSNALPSAGKDIFARVTDVPFYGESDERQDLLSQSQRDMGHAVTGRGSGNTIMVDNIEEMFNIHSIPFSYMRGGWKSVKKLFTNSPVLDGISEVIDNRDAYGKTIVDDRLLETEAGRAIYLRKTADYVAGRMGGSLARKMIKYTGDFARGKDRYGNSPEYVPAIMDIVGGLKMYEQQISKVKDQRVGELKKRINGLKNHVRSLEEESYRDYAGISADEGIELRKQDLERIEELHSEIDRIEGIRVR